MLDVCSWICLLTVIGVKTSRQATMVLSPKVQTKQNNVYKVYAFNQTQLFLYFIQLIKLLLNLIKN